TASAEAIEQTLARAPHAQRARTPPPALSRLCAVSRAACAFARLLRDREARARPRMARVSLAFSRMSFGSAYRSMISQSLRNRRTAAARARGDSGRVDCFGNCGRLMTEDRAEILAHACLDAFPIRIDSPALREPLRHSRRSSASEDPN